MIRKLSILALVLTILVIIVWGVWPLMTNPAERERFQKKQELMEWVNSCPTDATLSGKSMSHYDTVTGETNIIILVCKSKAKSKDEVVL